MKHGVLHLRKINRGNKNNFWVLVFILLLFFIAPPLYLKNLYSNFYYGRIVYIKMGIECFCILRYLYKKQWKINELLISVCIFLGAILISSFFSSMTLLTWLWFTLDIIVIFMMTDMLSKQTSYFFYKMLFIYFLSLLIINLILMVNNPEGIYFVEKKLGAEYDYMFASLGYHFLGNDNRLIVYIMPTLIISQICMEKKYISKLIYAIAMCVCLVTVVFVWSVNSVVFVSSYLIFQILKSSIIGNWFDNYKKVILTIIITNILVVIIQIQQYARNFIEIVFDKSKTVTIREEIWDLAIDMFMESPFWGYGNSARGYVISRAGVSEYAHNLILDILMNGGLLLLGSFVIMVLIMMKKTKKCQDRNIKKMILISWVCLAFANIAESQFYQELFYLSMAVCAMCPSLNIDVKLKGDN